MGEDFKTSTSLALFQHSWDYPRDCEGEDPHVSAVEKGATHISHCDVNQGKQLNKNGSRQTARTNQVEVPASTSIVLCRWRVSLLHEHTQALEGLTRPSSHPNIRNASRILLYNAPVTQCSSGLLLRPPPPSQRKPYQAPSKPFSSQVALVSSCYAGRAQQARHPDRAEERFLLNLDA